MYRLSNVNHVNTQVFIYRLTMLTILAHMYLYRLGHVNHVNIQVFNIRINHVKHGNAHVFI